MAEIPHNIAFWLGQFIRRRSCPITTFRLIENLVFQPDSIFLDFLEVFGERISNETFTAYKKVHSTGGLMKSRRVVFDTSDKE